MSKKRDGFTTFEGTVPVTGGVIGMENAASADESTRTSRASEAFVENLRGQDIAFWGDETNLFPQEVNEDVEASDILETIIQWKAQALTGGGNPIYGPLVPGPGGQPMIEPMSLNEVDDFFEETNIGLYAVEAGLDYYRYWNATAELITVGGRVTGIWSQDQSWIRLAQNDRTGAIRKAYLSTDWSMVRSVDDRKRVQTFDALDPYYDVAGQIAGNSSGRMLLPLRYQTRGRKYYALAPWNGFRESEWFQVQKKVPQAKKALLDNMAIVRYLIYVDDRYWPRAYPDWVQNVAQQEARKKAFKTEFETWIAGVKNNGKSLLLAKMAFPNAQEALKLIEFETLKFEIPTGAYIEDSTEADFHALRAHGVQPGLLGLAPSKQNSGGGSGSVNRVDWTNHLIGERPHGHLLLAPVRAACTVNRWNARNKKKLNGRRLAFMWPNLYATTLDRTQQVDAQPNRSKDTADGTVQDNG